jgi:hypothetical protein
MGDEIKSKLLKRLAEGRAKMKAARDHAKANGLPDPKPRKARARAEPVDPKMAIPDPIAIEPAREEIRPISGAKANDVNAVAAAPVDPQSNVTSKIDVPNLPGNADTKGRKKPVDDAEAIPVAKAPKDLSTTGKTKAVDVNNMIVNQETGNQAISTQSPGQKESILKLLKTNKKEDKPLANAPVPSPPEKTVRSVFKHVPDLKAVEGRAPFSFAAIRKQLYQ